MSKEILKITLRELAWFFGSFIIVLILSFGFVKVFDLIAQSYLQLEADKIKRLLYPFHLIFTLLLQNIIFLSVIILRRNSEQPRINNWKSNVKRFSIPKMIIFGIALALILFILNYLHQLLLLLFFDKSEIVSNLWLAVRSFNTFEKICMCFLGVIIAPIVEELYFREVVCGSIFRSGFPNFAIFFSSAIFSIAHMDFVNIFGYLTVSIAFALVYLKTRSVIPTITAHIVYNSISLSIYLFFT